MVHITTWIENGLRVAHRQTQPKEMRQFFGCATPQEPAMHHRVLTAALASHKSGQVVAP